MKNWKESRKYGLLFSVALVCLTLLAAVQVSAFDGQKPDGREPGHPCCCDRAASCHGAGGWQGEMRHHKLHRILMAFKKLDLTEGQKSEIHEIWISMKKDMIRKRADLKIAQMELHGQLHQDMVDMHAVELQVKKIEGLKTDMKLNAIKSWEEIKSKLTPDQRKHLADLIRDSRKCHDQRHHEG